MFADSTNIDRKGFTGPEIEVIDAFEELFTSTDGKLVVALFSSSIFRMQVLVDLAAQFDRKVAFVGRSIVKNAEIAQRLGFLRVPAGIQIRDSDVPNYPAQEVLCLATGSQGEPQAALSRIAIDDHRHVRLGQDDVVVLSARAIPGNEKAIARTMSHVARRGADMVTDSMKHVHVSGHGSAEELKLVMSLIRPRYFVPIHGEYRQLSQHARVARRVMAGREPKLQVLLAQDGDIIQFDAKGARIADKAPTGRVLIDVTRIGEVGDEVLRDRRHLAADGIVIAVVAIGRQNGTAHRRARARRSRVRIRRRGRGIDVQGCGGRHRGMHRVVVARGTYRSRADDRETPRGTAEILQETFRPAAAGPAGPHGDLMAKPTLARRISEFIGVALFALALIWLIALVTYDPSDPAWFFTTDEGQAPANFVGRVGAFLSELSFQLFGYGSYLLPALLAVAGWHYFWCQPPDAAYTKGFGVALFFACASAFLSMLFGSTELDGKTFHAGGSIGNWLGGAMSEYLNRTGSIIVLLTTMTLSVIISTHFSFGRLFETASQESRDLSARGVGWLRRWYERAA